MRENYGQEETAMHQLDSCIGRRSAVLNTCSVLGEG